jgi:hypothetical protein
MPVNQAGAAEAPGPLSNTRKGVKFSRRHKKAWSIDRVTVKGELPLDLV